MADLFKQETRQERKQAHYAAAKRWALRLPDEKGKDRKQCYEIMMRHFRAALRA